MVMPSSFHLTEAEKLEACALLLAGCPLPELLREKIAWSSDTLPRENCPERAGNTLIRLVERERICARTAGEEKERQRSTARTEDQCLGVQDESAAWANKLIHGDNIHILQALQAGPLQEAVQSAGGIKLIYMDPPFAVGADFSIPLEIGVGGSANMPAVIAFKDTWGDGPKSFFSMLYERLRHMHALLDETGSMYVHCDRRAAPAARLFMDYIFGPERFLGEIIWHYTGGGRAKRYFSRKHDVILHYAKSDTWTFNLDAIRVPYKKSSGYAKGGIVSAAGKQYLPHPGGTPIDDVWSIPIVNPMGKERLSYPTQKPESLLERIILASSEPRDIVADFFCGSGTTLAVAERLGRKWIGADVGAFAIHTTRKRLLAPPVRSEFSLIETADSASRQPVYLGKHSFDYGQPHITVERVRVEGGFRVILQGFQVADTVEGRGQAVQSHESLSSGAGTEPSTALGTAKMAGEGHFCIENGLLQLAAGPSYAPLMTDWSDWVDYWSVDPASISGLFLSRWQSFRTRRNRTLEVQSPIFPEPPPGTHVSVLLVDIFCREYRLEFETPF